MRPKAHDSPGRARSGLAMLAVLAGLALGFSPAVAAQDSPGAPAATSAPPAETEPADDQPTAERQAIDSVLDPFADGEPAPEGEDSAEPGEDECDRDLEDHEIQEQSRDIVYGATCHTFRWFDGLWGEQQEFREDEVNGLVLVGTRWSDYYGLDPRFRLRVRAKLPNLTRRWDVILGRVDEEAYVSDTQGQDRTFYNPAAIDRQEDPEWLLGLGHRGSRRKSGWDYSVGVRLRLPPRPYVKAQWYYNKDVAENADFRFRQTFFWRSDRGFGVTTRGDLAWSVDQSNVLRLEAFGTKHDDTRGVQWYAGHTWYHLLQARSAFSLRSFVRGETDAEVPLQEYGFDMIWRRPFTRDWIYLSVGPSVTWPREFETDERKINFGFNLWLEMEFGNWAY